MKLYETLYGLRKINDELKQVIHNTPVHIPDITTRLKVSWEQINIVIKLFEEIMNYAQTKEQEKPDTKTNDSKPNQ